MLSAALRSQSHINGVLQVSNMYTVFISWNPCFSYLQQGANAHVEQGAYVIFCQGHTLFAATLLSSGKLRPILLYRCSDVSDEFP